MKNFKDLILKELDNLKLRIILDDCEIDSLTALTILSSISHEIFSKIQACDYLHISRSKFDNLINLGKIPPGKKKIGFNELIWYKDDLIKFKIDKDGKNNKTE